MYIFVNQQDEEKEGRQTDRQAGEWVREVVGVAYMDVCM